MSKKIVTVAITMLMSAGFCAVLEAQRNSDGVSFRFSLGIAPGIDEVEDSTGTYDVNDDEGSRLEILAVKRFWDVNNPEIGWSIGGGFFFGSHSMSEPGYDVDLSTFGTMVQGGVIFDMGGGFILEFGPYLGAGVADNETEGFSDGTGPYFLYGIKGSALIELNENIEIGVNLGYEGFTHEQEYDFGLRNEDVTYSGHGAHVALIFGVNF